MHNLKYLGKPAPYPKGREDWSQTYQRNQHLEKAIKEAAELLTNPQKDISEYCYALDNYRGFKQVNKAYNVAFLLRRTIGERT